MNTNYIIIGIVVAALIGGGMWWAKSGSPPDPSVLEKGVKNLSRDAAAAKIKEYLQLNPPLTGNYAPDTKTHHFYISYVKEDSDQVKALRRLVAEGYATIVSEKKSYDRPG